jgi:hypothetical protein
MKGTDDTIAVAHILGQDFFKMVRQHKHEGLAEWIDHATGSEICALKGFAMELRKIWMQSG